MNAIDNKIFEFIELLKQQGEIRFNIEFARAIGMSKQHLQIIKTNDKRHFTAEHIQSICNKFRMNANWLFNKDISPFLELKNSNIKSIKKVILAEF